MRFLIFIVLFTAVTIVCKAWLPSSQVDLKIPTSSGMLHGKIINILNKRVKQFLGVPYAEPPVGNLRFRPPVKLESRSVLRESVNFAPSCIQPIHMSSVISPLLDINLEPHFSEDCLYLNVYVPEQATTDNLPVMVWLPGEGFDFGDATQFDGSYLAAQGKVIVITVNYRLSAFGFLAMPDLLEEAPGNLAIKDIILSLNWIQKNIINFGGNRNKVTLFGRFTGSMIAAILAFSPSNENLFQRVILQSGIPVENWVFDQNAMNTTLTLAKALNCPISEPSLSLECVKRQPVYDILLAALPLRFRPHISPPLIGEKTLKAAELSFYTPVDVMIGMTKHEGSLCLLALSASQSSHLNDLVNNNITKENYQSLLHEQISQFYKVDDELLTKVTQYKYSGGNLREQFIDFCGDMHLKSPALHLANLLAKKSENIFVYEFRHRPSFSIFPDFIQAAHGEDVLFSFGLSLKKSTISAEETHLSKNMMDAFSNFANTGNPNFGDSKEWPRYQGNTKDVKIFDTSDYVVRDSQKQDKTDKTVEFWMDIMASLKHRPCLTQDQPTCPAETLEKP